MVSAASGQNQARFELKGRSNLGRARNAFKKVILAPVAIPVATPIAGCGMGGAYGIIHGKGGVIRKTIQGIAGAVAGTVAGGVLGVATGVAMPMKTVGKGVMNLFGRKRLNRKLIGDAIADTFSLGAKLKYVELIQNVKDGYGLSHSDKDTLEQKLNQDNRLELVARKLGATDENIDGFKEFVRQELGLDKNRQAEASELSQKFEDLRPRFMPSTEKDSSASA